MKRTLHPSKSRRIGSGLFVACLVVGLQVVWADGEGAEVSLRPDDTATVAAGRDIYAEHCAACHGGNLQGEVDWQKRKPDGRLPAPPHDATGHTWHHDDALLFRITKFGTAALIGGGYQSDMAGYETVLTDDDIISVLSFIKSRWPASVRKRHDQINASRQ